MLKRSFATASLRLTAGIAALALTIGCGVSFEEHVLGEKTPEKDELATQSHSRNQESQNTGNVIVSDGPITVENGKVTYGPPELTADVEKEIYKVLNAHLTEARDIEKRVPGGNRASRQSREIYEIAKKSFVMRYEISESDIASILRKGAEEGWDDGSLR